MKKAFTLAEVLITLGIIGVVAALTIPTVIDRYQKLVLKQQFKKFYSTFSQVLNQVYLDNGMTVPECYYSARGNDFVNKSPIRSSCRETSKQILSKLKVIKICKGNAFNEGCIPNYNGIETVGHTSGVHGFTTDYLKNNVWVYELSDGTILIPYENEWSGVISAIFAADINGKKGPNKWGYDLFAFFIVTDVDTHNKYYLIGGTYNVENGGIKTSDMIKNL